MLNAINSMSQGHILIFDSGLGGTTILHELQQALPNCSYSYALDNAAFPYGSQDDTFLLERSEKLFRQLLQRDPADLVVIACNTASTLFLTSLRQQFPDTAFIGVVPAIKPAAQISRSKTIALLATPATVVRPYIDELHRQFAQDCQLIRLSHPDLAILAEHKIRYGKDVQQPIHMIVEQLKQQASTSLIDTIILGCTHYPAIAKELSTAWGNDVVWLDSGEAVARRAQQVIASSKSQTRQKNTLYLTATIDQQCISNSLSCYLDKPSLELISI